MTIESNTCPERTPRIAWIVAVAFLAIGIPAWAMQMLSPRFGEGEVTWGLNIDLFFLFAGVGAALLLLVGVSCLTDVLPKIRERSRSFAIVPAACLAGACLAVFLDAGRPMRVFEIIFRPQLGSLFVWDFYAIVMCIIVDCTVIAGIGRTRKVPFVAGVICGLLVMLVEGCILVLVGVCREAHDTAVWSSRAGCG